VDGGTGGYEEGMLPRRPSMLGYTPASCANPVSLHTLMSHMDGAPHSPPCHAVHYFAHSAQHSYKLALRQQTSTLLIDPEFGLWLAHGIGMYMSPCHLCHFVTLLNFA
jgi:hypothetical protein